jgi:hypothetical protein
MNLGESKYIIKVHTKRVSNPRVLLPSQVRVRLNGQAESGDHWAVPASKHHNTKAYTWRSKYPRILNLGNRRRWITSFALQPLCCRGNSSGHSLDRKQGAPQRRSGNDGGKKNPCSFQKSNPGRPASKQSLYLLSYPGSFIPNSMEQSPSWEANSRSASQEIPRLLWHPSLVHILS